MFYNCNRYCLLFTIISFATLPVSFVSLFNGPREVNRGYSYNGITISCCNFNKFFMHILTQKASNHKYYS